MSNYMPPQLSIGSLINYKDPKKQTDTEKFNKFLNEQRENTKGPFDDIIYASPLELKIKQKINKISRF